VHGYLFRRFVAPGDRATVIIAALLAMPMPLIVVGLIYYPQIWWLQPRLGPGLMSVAVILLTPPLIEEPAKWLVLFLPRVRRALRSDNAVVIALAVGFGFAVVEFWTQAHSISGNASYQEGWLLVCLTQPVAWLVASFVHGGFIIPVATRLAAGRPVWPGALLGIGLHFAANLIAIRWVGPLSVRLAGQALTALVWAAVITALTYMIMRGLGINVRELMLGKPIACPSCGKDYDRPWLAFNLGPVSYERCPHCRKLQWVRPSRSKAAAPATSSD
jgi:RsiW-degrading membrane proteinase PrsW (M82 family)